MTVLTDATLADRFQKLARTLGDQRAQREVHRERVSDLGSRIAIESDVAHQLERAAMLLNSIGETRQADAQTLIERVVTQGLQAIFDPSLSFHVVPVTKGKTSGIEFIVRTNLGDEAVETPVLEARGGGVSAVIGFLLRAVILLLSGDGVRRILVLDESFAHVSADHLEALGQFLRTLVDRTHLQVILVTHQDALQDHADKVYRFGSVNGRTVVSDG